MSVKKPSTSNDSMSSSDSDEASDSTSNSSSSSSSEASIDQKVPSVTKFSILKNDSGTGLRMKIAAIPKSPFKKQISTVVTNTDKPTLDNDCFAPKSNSSNAAQNSFSNVMQKKRLESTTNSSCCSACTESDDDSDSSSVCLKNQRTKKTLKHSDGKIDKTGSGDSSSGASNSDSSDGEHDSSDSESLAGCLLTRQQKYKKDLVKKNNREKVETIGKCDQNGVENLGADGASSSDMELPALVRAAIQRVESCSDGESSKPEANNTQYTSSLLREFVAKTQLLGSNITNANHILSSKDETKTSDVNARTALATKQLEESTLAETYSKKLKKKRGRPRKQPALSVDVASNNNSGSPDSGITSTPQSPVPLTSANNNNNNKKKNNNSSDNAPKVNKKSTMTIAKKLDISTLEKSIYATERVLYPPRRKKPNACTKTPERNRADEKIDPAWRKIDINKKFRRPSLCGYRSDCNTVCSKVLAAQSGYISDYGNINRRILSGYKSDYSCKSRRSGYKSDFSVKAKSCGYRSDCSIKHRRKVRRKRRTKTMSSKPPLINDQDILLLAGLSLGQSEESSLDSNSKNTISSDVNAANEQPTFKRSFISNFNTSARKTITKSGNEILSSLCERVTKRIGLDRISSPQSDSIHTITSDIYKDGESNSFKLDGIKPGIIRRRRSSAVSHCSSHCSTSSRHPFRRRRRKRLKSTNDQFAEINLTQLNIQIDQLTNSFSSLCSINVEKTNREKDKNSTASKTAGSKRVVKKRKANENTENTTSANTTKRRNKKAVQTKSPDDHKLPLKKRHYLMTPGEKSAESDDKKKEEVVASSTDAEIIGKAITPKKRHLLQTPADVIDAAKSTETISTNKDIEKLPPIVTVASATNAVAAKTCSQSKKIEIARKKNRLEGLVSKIVPNARSTTPAANVKSAQKAATSSVPNPKPLPTEKTTAVAVKPAPPSKSVPITKSVQTSTSTPTSASASASASASVSASASTSISTQSTTTDFSSTKTSYSRSPNVRYNKGEPVPPPGVFEPTIDLELQIPFTEISIPSMTTKTDSTINDASKTNATSAKDPKKEIKQKTERVVEKLLHRTGVHSIIKKKRKKPNRTGFPTLKKKKKPATKAESVAQSQEMIVTTTKPNSEEIQTTNTVDLTIAESTKSPQPIQVKSPCDRVPSEGETTCTFIERNSRPRLSVVSLERLQAQNTNDREQSTENVDEKSSNKMRTKNDRSNNVSKQSDGAELPDDEPLINFLPKKTSKKSGKNSNQLPVKTVQIDSAKLTEVVDKKNSNKCQKTQAIESDGKQTTAPIVVADESQKNKSEKVNKTGIFTRRSQDTVNVGKQKRSRCMNEDALNSEPLRKLLKPTKSTSKATLPVKKSTTEAISVDEGNLEGKATNKARTITTKLQKESKASFETSKLLNENTKLAKGVKRNINGRVINATDEIPSTAETKQIEETHENGKKFRRDNDIDSKVGDKKNKKNPIKSNAVTSSTEKKRSSESTNHVVKLSPVDQPAKNSNKKIKVTSNDEHVVEESITDLADITKIDDKNDVEHDPLPPSENVNSVDRLGRNPVNDGKKVQSKQRKKFLVAGLFSNYYKESQSPTDKISKTVARTDEKPENLLPAPEYCEKYIRRAQIDFCLPYDLWLAHENGKLPGRNVVHSWNFKKIRTNVYCESVKPNQSSDLPQCSCKPEYQCGENCLNRLVYTECVPEMCPCGDKCKNTKIQRHIIAPGVERFMTANKGWGVQTKLVIKKGTYILEYVGEVVTEREFKERMATLYTSDIHHYCLHLDGGLVIDGHRMGSDCRFVNHSCEPNCEMQKWSVNGLSRMALFALRDINPGEELTYDYNFSLFNPAEGQICKCESDQCRGVIGGKSQRIRPIENKNNHEKTTTTKKGRSERSGRPKRGGGSKSKGFMHSKDNTRRSTIQMPSSKEQSLVANGHCFLLRNLRKIRLANSSLPSAVPPSATTIQASLTAKISALRVPRNIRTRGVTIAEHDPVIEKTVRIAGVLREICEELNNFKDASGQYAISKLNLPSKKKCPQYFEKIKNPIDLSTIETNVEKGVYDKPTLFDADVMRLFSNAIEYYGNDSPEATITLQLQTVYARKKSDMFSKLVSICGESTELSSLLKTQSGPFLCPIDDPNEEHIQCICGLYRDEGIMIQCSECKKWQHTECTGADVEAERYLCEKCSPREVNYEIPLKEKTDEGYTYYLSLMRGKDLQIRQSDTVYVLRDIPIETKNGNSANEPVKKHTYETIGDIDFSECDIFRIERMWKDHDGKRFVFGHHYLRPHETYHEPTRKFYQNEVVRVPLYEVVPIELVMGRCWVMDFSTFCKGRPVDSVETHVYICELRVDKAARLFSKISKNPYPVCTKSYAFKKFRQKLKISRSYLPHDVDLAAIKQTKRRRNVDNEVPNQPLLKKNSTPIVQLMPPPQKTMNEKRTRLESHLSNLMGKQRAANEGIQPLDLSYLLTGRGARRRTTTATNVPNKN